MQALSDPATLPAVQAPRAGKLSEESSFPGTCAFRSSGHQDETWKSSANTRGNRRDFFVPAQSGVGNVAVKHTAGEYARGNVHTNTIEGYFSLLKRGLIGTFHHVGAQHLKRYMTEFDFRYNSRKNTDVERATAVLRGIGGKRLTYRKSAQREQAI